MAKEAHETRQLDRNEAVQLYDAIRAVESLQAEIDDIRSDLNERKQLACETLKIRKDVVDFIIKRRKTDRANVGDFDQMLEFLEEAVAEVERDRREASLPGNHSDAHGAALQ